MKDFKERLILCFRDSLYDEDGESYLVVYKYELEELQRELGEKWEFLEAFGYISEEVIAADIMYEGSGIFMPDESNSRLIGKLAKDLYAEYAEKQE